MLPSVCFVVLGFAAAGSASPRQQTSVSASSPSSTALQAEQFGCAVSVRDQANPSSCLQASSVPTPGLLFPPPHDGGRFNVTGGTDSFIGDGFSNRTIGDLATIGGGRDNEATTQAVVGGGALNRASGAFGVVAGGYFNTADGYFSSVGGGYGNFAGYKGAVGGGQYNSAGYRGTVAGGWLNSAFGSQCAVGGGEQNEASGSSATVPGGSDNRASGNFSFAAGRRAKAAHAGSFVWGDSPNVDKTSSSANQFNVYASGGTRIFSDATATAGVLLAPGGGSWSSVSDRATKENFTPVDTGDVLERLRSLPIATWNFKTQEDSIRHMGPVAQDFRALFGLGTGETTIDTIDADGVALAAIQGLQDLVAAQAAQIAALEARLAGLEAAAPAAASGGEPRLQKDD